MAVYTHLILLSRDLICYLLFSIVGGLKVKGRVYSLLFMLVSAYGPLMPAGSPKLPRLSTRLSDNRM